MRLSTYEKRLIDFGLKEFGETPTQFLLAGLGNDELAQGWLFKIEFTEQGTNLRREIEVSSNEYSDGSIRLPQRREPLIILALLRLLIAHDQTSSANLSYKLEEVLEILGWRDTAQSRRTIDEAVERYSNLTYWWTMSADELALKKLTCYESRECFVSGFSCLDKESKNGGHLTRVVNRIDFNEDFVKGLRKRFLFEIDWNSVQSIECIPILGT